MGVSIIGILPSQEARMIRKRKAFSVYSILNLLCLLVNLDAGVHPKHEDMIVLSLDSRGIFSFNRLCERMLGLIVLTSR